MGYCMNQTGCQFVIKRENQKPALAALKVLMTKDSLKGGGSSGGGRWFSFCNGADVENWTNLAEAMADMRWECSLDEDFNIVGLEFMGEKLGDDNHLFGAISEFVESGSYIQMRGEDGDQWRWIFEGGKVKEVHPDVEWPE